MANYKLGLIVSGPANAGTITGTMPGFANISCGSGKTCAFDIAPGTEVTLSGTQDNFYGFKVPYCQVNTCNWDDPEFVPPPYAWSKDPYTFKMTAPMTVSAGFGPLTVKPIAFNLSLIVSGPAAAGTITGTITGVAGSRPITWTIPSVPPALPTQSADCGPGSICTVVVTAGDSVTLTPGTPTPTNFVGFKLPYCQVNPCDWDDPEFMPPPYAWSTADYTVKVTAPLTVSAGFTTP